MKKHKSKKYTLDELTRLAFVWADQDRASLALCWPAGSPERAKVQNELDQIRAYRLKRWGKTRGDVLDESPAKMMIISPRMLKRVGAPDIGSPSPKEGRGSNRKA